MCSDFIKTDAHKLTLKLTRASARTRTRMHINIVIIVEARSHAKLETERNVEEAVKLYS